MKKSRLKYMFIVASLAFLYVGCSSSGKYHSSKGKCDAYNKTDSKIVIKNNR